MTRVSLVRPVQRLAWLTVEAIGVDHAEFPPARLAGQPAADGERAARNARVLPTGERA